jgi:hypothetical protein
VRYLGGDIFASYADIDGFYPHIRHFFGALDGLRNRFLNGFYIDYDAGFNSQTNAVSQTDDFKASVVKNVCNATAYLGAANVEDGNDAT